VLDEKHGISSKARVGRERAFHDDLYRRRPRAALDSYYSLLGSSARFYSARALSNCAANRVLELGCGQGSIAVALAQAGAFVDAIDISPVAIATAREDALARNASVTFDVMSAETLEYPDASFDLVCGRSVLHHLHLGQALREVRRVLKPGGAAVFLEPLGHNPLLNLVRRLTPQLRSPDEQPLLVRDLQGFHRDFVTVSVHYFHLASLLGLPMGRLPGGRSLLALLEAVDGLLLATPLRRYAWIVVVCLSEPRPRGDPQSRAF
jgi:SAM-dependent methyltransferase